MLIAIRPPATNDCDPLYMRGVLTGLLTNHQRESFTLYYAALAGETQLVIDVPRTLINATEKYLRAKYPDIETKRLDRRFEPGPTHVSYSRSLRLKPDIEPLIHRKHFEDQMQRNFIDPASTFLQAVQDVPGHDVSSLIRFHVTPATTWQRWRAKWIYQRINHPWWSTRTALRDWYAHLANSRWHKRVLTWPLALFFRRVAMPPGETTDKLNSTLTNTSIDVLAWGPHDQLPLLRKQLDVLAAAFTEFTNPGRTELASHRTRSGVKPGPTSLLSVEDLAALWHVPTTTVHTPTLARPTFRQLPPPVNLPPAEQGRGAARIGRIAFEQDDRICYVPEHDRLHSLITGKSGMGKSTLMHNLIAHDAHSGQGVAVIDPHSDLVTDILPTLPRNRTNDIVLMDVADRSTPITINPLACSDPFRRPLVASSLLTALKKVFEFDETSAPRLINTLRYTLLALLEQPNTTMLDIEKMLVNKGFRKQVSARIEDPKVRSFWNDEVPSWTERYYNEAIPAITNKIGQFTANPITRSVLSDPKGSIDLRTIMDQQKILLVSLSQGLIGEDAAKLLGALFMASIQQAAMSRADLEKDQRSFFNVYMDEYPVYASAESLGDLLSQSRKYGIRLNAAQQVLSQSDENLMALMFGNVSTLISFQMAYDDAEVLANQLGSPLEPADLLNLPKYHAITRLTLDGVPTRPFTVQALPPPGSGKHTALAAAVRKVSRSRYGSKQKSASSH